MNRDFDLDAYHYNLPQENIAQTPANQRDRSRLLILNTESGDIRHRQFADIEDYLRPGDVLVVNDTRVFPARLHGHKETGGKVEVFLLNFPEISSETAGLAICPGLIKSSKRPKPDSTITIGPELTITVTGYNEGKAQLRLNYNAEWALMDLLQRYGQVPLPPYINREAGTTEEDEQRYQTVFANEPGAVAAPTAGLHFTTATLERLKKKNINIVPITLNVGYGTFAPVRHHSITDHSIHEEYLHVPEQTVGTIRRAKEGGGRIWAVGTTSVRALEFCAKGGELEPTSGWCDLYIYPGFEFKVVDNLITNFHLPESSLLFLVSALCGRETLLACYGEAIEKGYRFYSYGDAMAVITKP